MIWELIELHSIKDTSNTIWKRYLYWEINKQKPKCINDSKTEKCITNPDQINIVTLKHNLGILKKTQVRNKDKVEFNFTMKY